MHKSSRPFRLLAAVITVALAATLMVVGAAPAGAVPTGTHGNRVVSDDPANNTPHVLNGYVNSFAQVGDVMVVGGNFTTVATASAPNTNIARSHLFAFNIATGRSHRWRRRSTARSSTSSRPVTARACGSRAGSPT